MIRPESGRIGVECFFGVPAKSRSDFVGCSLDSRVRIVILITMRRRGIPRSAMGNQFRLGIIAIVASAVLITAAILVFFAIFGG